jgi:hypothetical protein
MTSYAPNELRYHCDVASERPVIFSEIYYPEGWHAEIHPADGSAPTSVELFRADWILRGAVLPAGEYDLVMRFDPKIYSLGESVSRASSIVLVLLLLAVCGMMLTAKRETPADIS